MSSTPVLTAVLKRKPLVACPHCGKSFLNVEEHITKTHKANKIHMMYHKDEGEWECSDVTYSGIKFNHYGGGSGESAFYFEETPESVAKFGKGWFELIVRVNQETGVINDFYLYKTMKTGKYAGQVKRKNLCLPTCEITRDED
jgi:hypothetical protein